MTPAAHATPRHLVTPYWLPKAGSSTSEYEDACAPRRQVRWSKGGRCAVADGATEAAYSAIWAKILVRAFCTGWLRADGFRARLAPLRLQWDVAVDGLTAGRPVPWYLEEKRRLGAFAALVGLELQPGGAWRALAVGDCCLFHLRAGALSAAFPLSESAQFGSSPALIGTRPRHGDSDLLRVASGEWLPGDVFLLMSDALAAWFLRTYEDGAPGWPLPAELAASDKRTRMGAFAAWLAQLRAARSVRNDDATLVRVDTAESADLPELLDVVDAYDLAAAV